MVTLIDIDREIVRRQGLHGFVRLAWPEIRHEPFVDNWHLGEVSKHLEAVSAGDITRLVICQPPGTMKSLMLEVFWPAWHFRDRPETAFMYASYDHSLVYGFAEKMFELMTGRWYIERWGLKFKRTKPAMADIETTKGGGRFSTSIGGKLTGRHFDIQCVDDPNKPTDTSGGSEVTRAKLDFVSEWYHGTAATRARDISTFRRVVNMQRLHDDDLAGECIAAGYEYLRLPMRYDSGSPCVTSVGGDRRKVEGELLWAARFPEDAVAKQEIELCDHASAQLQQEPTRKGGGIFRDEWFQDWIDLPLRGQWIQSWDCTFKAVSTSDKVAGGVWLASGGKYYLVDQINERLELPGTLNAMRAMTEKYPLAYDKLIEDKANGPAVEQTLRHEIPGITLVTPMGGKEARANAIAPTFAAMKVYIPRYATWAKEYKAQLTRFPRAAFDDMVDQTSQALIYLKKYGDNFSEAMKKLREGQFR